MGSCRIIRREYVNSANFKNWAIPQARHGWVMVLDAEERLTAELAAEIRTALASEPDCEGFRLFGSHAEAIRPGASRQ